MMMIVGHSHSDDCLEGNLPRWLLHWPWFMIQIKMIYFQTKRRSLFCSGFLEKLAGSTLWKWSKVNKKCKMLTKKGKENPPQIYPSLLGRMLTSRMIWTAGDEDHEGRWSHLLWGWWWLRRNNRVYVENLSYFGTFWGSRRVWQFPKWVAVAKKDPLLPARLAILEHELFYKDTLGVYICTPVYLLVVFWIYLWEMFVFGF